MTTQMKQQLTPEARSALFQHFKNDDIKEGRLSHYGISRPHSLRLMIVSSDFCDATRHALKHSTLQITSRQGSESRWEFVTLNSRTSASAQALIALVQPKFGCLAIRRPKEFETEMDEQFVRRHFVGIPKLTVESDVGLRPHIHRLIVLMAPKLRSLTCNAKYLERTGDFPLLKLNDCKLCSCNHKEPLNMDLLLAHRIEKIQLDLVRSAENPKLVLSENGLVQPALKELVLDDWSDFPLLMPQIFYKRVPNLKKQIHLIRLRCFYAASVPGVLKRLQTLAEHGQAVLQANTNIEKLVYNADISTGRNVDMEEHLKIWQQTRFFANGKFSVLSKDQLREYEDAPEFNINYANATKVFVVSNGKMKFFVCVHISPHS
ncbi:hypothetical protein M3Y95_00827500 [Aphelenchoides besseyi]|nr:hypothetical protein M3Y95_00827500 [Aphelenchoides besseyi]